MHARAHCFGHGQGLARQHGLIGLRAALRDQSIGSETLAGLDRHGIADQQLRDRNVHFAVRADPMGARRAQGVQRADGRGGLALGAGLQPFAQHDQGNHQRRAFEIQMHHGAGRRT